MTLWSCQEIDDSSSLMPPLKSSDALSLADKTYSNCLAKQFCDYRLTTHHNNRLNTLHTDVLILLRTIIPICYAGLSACFSVTGLSLESLHFLVHNH